MDKWQGFYSTDQVARLTGIHKRLLYQWKILGIIAPSVQIIDANGKVEEGYSYSDLAIIKILHALKLRKLNLHSAVVAFRHLINRFGTPTGDGWSDAHVFIVNKEVFAQKPDDWETTSATRKGQKADLRVLGQLAEEEGALLVPKKFSDFIEINPDVMDGEPVIKDTRVPTYVLASMYGEGISIVELADLYSPISISAIKKAIEFEKYIEDENSKISTKTRTSVN